MKHDGCLDSFNEPNFLLQFSVKNGVKSLNFDFEWLRALKDLKS